jgi:hypothetical protein
VRPPGPSLATPPLPQTPNSAIGRSCYVAATNPLGACCVAATNHPASKVTPPSRSPDHQVPTQTPNSAAGGQGEVMSITQNMYFLAQNLSRIPAGNVRLLGSSRATPTCPQTPNSRIHPQGEPAHISPQLTVRFGMFLRSHVPFVPKTEGTGAPPSGGACIPDLPPKQAIPHQLSSYRHHQTSTLQAKNYPPGPYPAYNGYTWRPNSSPGGMYKAC